MVKLSGLRVSAKAVSFAFRNFGLLSRLAFPWAAFVTVIVLAGCVVFAWRDHQPIDIGKYLNRLSEGDLVREYIYLTSASSIFGELATAVGWSRFVLLGEKPNGVWYMPLGSARYLSRTLLLIVLCALLCVPGLAAGAVIGRFVMNNAGMIAAGSTIALGAVIALYICIRCWLIFPAVAIGDRSMTFRRSFVLTKGAVFAILLSAAVPYVPFILISSAISAAAEFVPEGLARTSAAVLSEFCGTFLTLAGNAAACGAMAEIYRALASASTMPAANASHKQ